MLALRLLGFCIIMRYSDSHVDACIDLKYVRGLTRMHFYLLKIFFFLVYHNE